MYIDTENAINQEFLEALGVDTQKLLYVPLESVEDIFDLWIQLSNQLENLITIDW